MALGDAVTIAVNGANIEVNGAACTPVATTAGVDTIIINAELLTEAENNAVTINGAEAISRPRSP